MALLTFEINLLKAILEARFEAKDYVVDDEILMLSQKLDELIVEYQKHAMQLQFLL